MSVVALVFPNRLFAEHPALADGAPAVLVEDDLSLRDERYPARCHKLRLAYHRATTRRYADDLERAGRDRHPPPRPPSPLGRGG